MIEIITQKVKMPPIGQRRYVKTSYGKAWTVKDAFELKVIYVGNFENASLICHNLNKKFYLTQP